MPTTHFRNGVSNSVPGSVLYDYGRLDPTTYVEIDDDFATYVAGNWTKTGTGTVALSSSANLAGGYVLLTNSAVNAEWTAIQLNGEAFRWAATKSMWFKAKFSTSDISATNIIAGLAITTATPYTAISDGIYINKPSGAAVCNLVINKTGGTTATVASGSLGANNAQIEIGWAYDGTTGLFKAYVGGNEAGSLPNTNAPAAEDLTITFAIQNGAGAIKTALLDYLFASQER